MKNFSPPPGYQARKFPSGCGWFRPGYGSPILAFWQKTGANFRLSQTVQRHPQAQRFAGRRTVTAAPIPGAGTLVIRPCAHGGWWGRLARDLYFGSGRAWREIRASEKLHRWKIPTPPIEAVLFYPAGPCTCMEVITPIIPGGKDLVRHLALRPGVFQRSRIFASVRKLIDQLDRHGIYHPDLNARNILLAPSPRGGITAWLLDVDNIRFREPGSVSVRQANRARLLRSLLKRARLGELGWSESEVPQLWRELFPHR